MHQKDGQKTEEAGTVTFIAVRELNVEGYDGTCLRPLGLCELGGCCDACWYSPTHPRFQKKNGDTITTT